MNVEAILERCDIGDCWIWQGATAGGYSHIYHRGKATRGHRAIWEELVGPIPEGEVIDHLCRVKLCLNPDHLEPVSQSVNIRRGTGVAAANARKTRCPYGHPYSGENLIVSKHGRACRECKNRRARLRYKERSTHGRV